LFHGSGTPHEWQINSKEVDAKPGEVFQIVEISDRYGTGAWREIKAGR
jgi:hypothetical protein